jgi:hypothetical protein
MPILENRGSGGGAKSHATAWYKVETEIILCSEILFLRRPGITSLGTAPHKRRGLLVLGLAGNGGHAEKICTMVVMDVKTFTVWGPSDVSLVSCPPYTTSRPLAIDAS